MSSDASLSLERKSAIRRRGRLSFRPARDFFSGFRRKYYGPITHVRTATNHVALTFDDGPHPDFTAALLGILRRFDAKATFFMVGALAARHPELVKKVAEDGHAIGNHSLTHPSFPSLDSHGRRGEILQCAEILHPYGQKLFRPPFGAENFATQRDATRLGYRVIKWNVSVDDWRDHPADWLAERLMLGLRPGSIALLHDNRVDDSGASRQPTLDAVEAILGKLSEVFDFCTVPRLLAMGQPMTSFRPVW